MVFTNALDRMHVYLDLLSRTKLGQDDVGIGWRGRVVAEQGGLFSFRTPYQMRGEEFRVYVEILGLCCTGAGLGVASAFELDVEDYGVVVGGRVVARGAHLHGFWVHIEGNEADALRKDFVLDDGGVVPDVDVLDGHGRHLSDHDPAECIGDGGVDADEVKIDGSI